MVASFTLCEVWRPIYTANFLCNNGVARGGDLCPRAQVEGRRNRLEIIIANANSRMHGRIQGAVQPPPPPIDITNPVLYCSVVSRLSRGFVRCSKPQLVQALVKERPIQGWRNGTGPAGHRFHDKRSLGQKLQLN